jgi:hypothetical protein
MRRETRHAVRRPVAGLVAVACLATLALADAAAAPATGAAVKVVTIAVSDRGKGAWSTTGTDEKGSLTISYNWSGTVTLKVPTTQLSNPSRSRLSASGSAEMRGSWTGEYSGTRFTAPDQGPYHCTYKASNVPIRVSATLKNGPSSKTLAIVLTRAAGFFPGAGGGADATCASAVGKEGPPHFEPSWLFRDNVSDHYRLSSNTAYLVLPRTLLSGKTTTSRFPNEIGTTKVALGPAIEWHNVGRLTAKKR